jgi:hypothetical protein
MRIGVNRSLLSLQGVTNRNVCNKVDSGARNEEQDYYCCTCLKEVAKKLEKKRLRGDLQKKWRPIYVIRKGQKKKKGDVDDWM